MSQPAITIALVGNPNTGKSTLFNALSGLRQRVGNYSGVTVEMKLGHFNFANQRFDIIDLPGTYSLAPRSPDEMVVIDLLLGRRKDASKPDLILSVVDAANLDRHLYLTTQLLELGLPVVLAVNMVDVAEAQGIRVDCAALAKSTGLPVVAIQANRNVGLEELKAAISNAAKNKSIPTAVPMPPAVTQEIEGLLAVLPAQTPTFLAARLLFDIGGSAEAAMTENDSPLKQKLEAARLRLTEAGHPIPATEAKARYGWIRPIVTNAVSKPAIRPKLLTDRIDRILTHKLWGTLVFLMVMLAVFLSIFVAAKPMMGWIEAVVEVLQQWISPLMDPGPLRGLIVDGIIGGVGSVIVFLPQILLLFLFIAVLEDCGYMARAAFVMDRLMSRCGLSGKSFIPLLSSVACAIPGILATRTIENRRDRFATILVAPLMSCAARLPVYTMLTAAFLGTGAGYAWWVGGLVLFGLYMIGFIVAPLMAMLFKRTILKGEKPAYVMELPLYRRPALGAVLRRSLEAGGAFLKRAGTFILATMIIIWALTYFPNATADGTRYDLKLSELESAAAPLEERQDDLTDDEKEQFDSLEEQTKALKQDWQRNSYLGRCGRFLEPVFEPLGWDWKLGMATLASFPAREVIVGTLGILYGMGDVDDEQHTELGEKIRDDWKDSPVRGPYGVPVALSVMVFFALCCQCASTLAAIYRETKSWRWPLLTFAYMTLLAYVAALLTFQIGKLIAGVV